VQVALGRTYAKLGDLDGARARLQEALTVIQKTGQLALLPPVYLTLGDVENDSPERQHEAQEYFERAAALWTDDLPDAASVEARCNKGLMEAERNAAAALAMVEASVRHAAMMGRLYTQAQCRLQLARIRLGQQHYEEALTALAPIPLDGERNVGPELIARVRYWRSRAMADQGIAAARAEGNMARSLIEELQAKLPTSYRAAFASRLEIARLLAEPAVQK